MPGASSNANFNTAPAANGDNVWAINDPYSQISIDHSIWDHFLTQYVITDSQGLNRVKYGNVSVADRQLLSQYLSQLQSVDPRTLNKTEQLAYWLNLYNSKTVSIVLENYPTRSIRKIKTNFFDFVGPFDDDVLTVIGKPLSLTNVESGILRPVWKDPRIHYALNCASYGCPNLNKRAWTPHKYRKSSGSSGLHVFEFGPRNQDAVFWNACRRVQDFQVVQRGLWRHRSTSARPHPSVRIARTTEPALGRHEDQRSLLRLVA